MKVINYIKQKKVPGKVKDTLYCGKKFISMWSLLEEEGRYRRFGTFCEKKMKNFPSGLLSILLVEGRLLIREGACGVYSERSH